MSQIEKHVMRPLEARTFDIDFSGYLYDGASITGATATVSTKLGGTVLTAGSPVVSGDVVYILLTAQSGAAIAPDRHSVKLAISIDNPSSVPDETPIHTIEISIRVTDD
jgi:hypothetical protein